MSKVQQIEAAIHGLSPIEREQLVSRLPKLLPELDGDRAWNEILQSATPRPTFSRYLDEIEKGLDSNSLQLRETSDAEFGKKS